MYLSDTDKTGFVEQKVWDASIIKEPMHDDKQDNANFIT
jgi:hypothetical protein